jgi:hypothetical protein
MIYEIIIVLAKELLLSCSLKGQIPYGGFERYNCVEVQMGRLS